MPGLKPVRTRPWPRTVEYPELTAAQQALVTAWLAAYEGKPVRLLTGTFPGLYHAARTAGMTDEDIASAALLGVCVAATKFDPDRPSGKTGKPCVFNTVAVSWARATVGHEANRYVEAGCRGPGGMPHPTLVSADSRPGRGEESGWTLIPDEGAVSAEDAAADIELAERVERLLRHLGERERRVLRLRFGLGGGKELPLRAVGAEIGVTRERTRQLQERALERLRRVVA